MQSVDTLLQVLTILLQAAAERSSQQRQQHQVHDLSLLRDTLYYSCSGLPDTTHSLSDLAVSALQSCALCSSLAAVQVSLVLLALLIELAQQGLLANGSFVRLQDYVGNTSSACRATPPQGNHMCGALHADAAPLLLLQVWQSHIHVPVVCDWLTQ